jgi:hypothetical protein
MTNSEGLALQKQMLKHLTGKTPKKKSDYRGPTLGCRKL